MEGIIDVLVDPKVNEELNKLQKDIDNTAESTTKWVDVLGQLEKKLNNVSTYKDYADLLSSLGKIEAGLNVEHEKRAKLEAQMQKITEASVKSMESLVAIEKKLEEATKNLTALQEKQAEVSKKQSEATEKQVKATKALTVEEKAANQISKERERATINQIKANDAQQGSLKQMRLELSNLNRAFDSLSKSQREGALGKELQTQINEIIGALNQAEAATGRFQRNVGNYQNSIMSAIGANKGFAGSIIAIFVNQQKLNAIQAQTATAMAGATTGFQKAGVAVKGFGMQLKALLLNPVVALIAVIVVAFKALAAGIKSSEEASNRMKQALAPLQVLFDGLQKVLQFVAKQLLVVVEGFAKMVLGLTKLAEKIPFVGKAFKKLNDAIDEKNDLVSREIQLEKDRRQMQIENAKTDADVASLRERLAQRDYKNAEEKMGLLKQAIALEEQQNAQRLKMAEEELELLKIRNRVTENDAETNQKLAEAEANLYKIRAEGSMATLRFQRQLAAAEQENLKEAIAASKIRIDIANVQRNAESEQLKKITADTKLSLEERTKAYEEYVKVQSTILQATAGLSIQEAEGDADKIRLIQLKLADDMRKLNEQAAEFRMNEIERLNARILTAQRTIIDLQINDELDKIKKIADNDKNGFIERASASQEYYDGRIKQLEESLRRELEAQNLHAEEIMALEAKTQSEIAKLRQTASAEQEKIMIDSMTRQIQIRRDAMKNDEMIEVAELSEQYARGLMKREDYEKQKLEIQKRYAQMSRDAERQAIIDSLEILQKTLDETKLQFPEIDTSAVEAQIAGLQSRLMQLSIESNEAIEGMAEGHKTLWEKWTQHYTDALSMEGQQLKEFANALSGTFKAVMDLIKLASDARLQAYDDEMKALQEKQSAEQEALKNSIMGDERRAIEQRKMQIRQEKEREEIEKKKKAEQRKQAQFEKRWALVQVLINTAVGVMKAAPLIPLMVAIGIMGAAQAAVVASQPIPAYAKGTKDGGHPETGLALVGDANRSEAIITPSGKIYKSPSKPTLVSLKKGTIVKPDFNRFVNEYANDVVNMSREVNNYSKVDYQELVESNRQQSIILREIAQKTGAKINLNLDRHGFFNSMKNESTRSKYINYEIHTVI